MKIMFDISSIEANHCYLREKCAGAGTTGRRMTPTAPSLVYFGYLAREMCEWEI